jgi:uncharacterized protein YecE (DUF72 family)
MYSELEIITAVMICPVVNSNWDFGLYLSWNKGKQNKFKWYIDQGFNSVEINGSFYRYPTENWI